MTTTLITGGTGGIGKALVESFAKRGDTVYFTYYSNAEKSQALEQGLAPHKVKGLPFNQGDYASLNGLLEKLPERIDVLINNAALGSATVEKFAGDKHEQDELLFKVNVLGTLWLTEAIIERMRRYNYGKIINLSSVGGGIYQYPGFRLADSMSKAAVALMTKQMAAEMVYEPIDIFAVCPGATATAMFDASTLKHLNEAEQQKLINALPKHRLIQPDEIAQLCLFLASNQSQVLHGAVIDASMGLGVNPACLKK
jgi:NAD(P)-dependent dehydrogenase (short-subunit alcohol dehydrogenase family)